MGNQVHLNVEFVRNSSKIQELTHHASLSSQAMRAARERRNVKIFPKISVEASPQESRAQCSTSNTQTHRMDVSTSSTARHLDEDLFCGTSTTPTVLRRPGRCTPCPGRLVRNRPSGAQQGHVNLVDAGLVQEDHDALDPVRDQLSRPSHSAESMECLLELRGLLPPP